MPTLIAYKILTATIIYLSLHNGVQAQYKLQVSLADQESLFKIQSFGLQTSFKDRKACAAYIENLPGILKLKGYPVASVDSVYFDSTSASAAIYLGDNFQIASLRISDPDRKILAQSGWNENDIQHKDLDKARLLAFQQEILDYLENNGYPFAKLQLDSILFEKGKIFSSLKIDKGPFYKIDSIRIFGKAIISNNFLQRYLEISNGSPYKKTRLQNISRKILELPYIEEEQPWNVTMLGTGAVLNVYLRSKKSNQVNVLIGFLPSNGQTKNNALLVTGEANIALKNALGKGEQIELNWQQIQVKSPRLNLAFRQPYLLGTTFGINTVFDLFKKDSSYLNLNFLLGLQYTLSGEQTGRIFFQHLKSNLLQVDTLLIKSNKKLPPEIDVSSINLGIDYEFNKTDYRLNPKRGAELQLSLSAGTRKIRRNNVIVKLYDPSFSYSALYDTVLLKSYQFRIKLNAAHYFQTGRQSTLKTALNAGWFQSPSVFRNELFQIGGYRLLRGFDEESIFASQYAVGTIEYRYLIGLNSYLFTCIDAGLTSNKSLKPAVSNSFIGGGAGLAFETKGGIFNISYAAGKKNDMKFNLRQSKIHLGYVNYF